MSETGNVGGTPEPCGTAVPTKSTTAGSPDVLRDLLARVEAATGLARELDGEIMQLYYTQDRRYIGCRCDPSCCPGGAHLDLVWVDPETDHWKTTASTGFEFTSSLDATIALAKRLGFYVRSEPRFHIDGDRVDFISYALRPKWDCWRPDDEWFDRGEAKHADQILSAVAALLKALIAQAASPA